MKLGVLFSGGKDSTYSCWLAKKEGHTISCLISVFSKNKDSFMFHTSSVEMTKRQAELMGVPILIKETFGIKEKEIKDLKEVIRMAVKKYSMEGVVSGAIESVYQASRIQKICNEFGIECFNPLWQKNQFELLEELLKNNFKIIISSVAAYPFDKSWVGREIDEKTIIALKKIHEKFKINPAGEGGEYETLVLDCPLFKKELKVKLKNVFGGGNCWMGLFK